MCLAACAAQAHRDGDFVEANAPPSTRDHALHRVAGLELFSVATQISAAHQGTCARLADGSAWCWGWNLQYDDTSHPTPYAPPGLTDVREIRLGDMTQCARRGDGRVLCWGQHWGLGADPLGPSGEILPYATRPTKPAAVDDVIQVAIGGFHACARRKDGSVWCWGADVEGSGPRWPTGDLRLPTAIAGLDGVAELALGDIHGCAKRTDGTVTCWGWDADGQLGDGTPAKWGRPPLDVVGLSGVTKLSLLGARSCVVREDGTVWCWGKGWDGASTVPTKLDGVAGVVELAIGERHTCARFSSGDVGCWGSNEFGQLGDGTTVARELPTRVLGLAGTIAQIAVGTYHSCALSAAGRVWCWGGNSFGSLGDGTKIDRATPVPVVW